MTPTKWIFLLFAAGVAWVPVSVYLGRTAASSQDAAGKGIYSAITIFFLLVVGGLSLGIPAVLQSSRHKAQVNFLARMAAWATLLSPVIVTASVMISELAEHMLRQ